jgi:hypothetical protein
LAKTHYKRTRLETEECLHFSAFSIWGIKSINKKPIGAENSISSKALDSSMIRGAVDAEPFRIAFDNLKLKGLISPSRILVHKPPSSRRIDFRTNRLRHRIHASGDMSKLPERSIAFSLLHEEGHLVRSQNSGWFSAIVMTIGMIVALLSIWHLLSRSQISFSEWAIYLTAIIITSFSPRMFRHWLIKDEIISDAFATKTMVRAYPGITQGEIAKSLDSVLKAMRPRKRDFAERIFLELMGWDIHPKDEERIRAILKSEESK